MTGKPAHIFLALSDCWCAGKGRKAGWKKEKAQVSCLRLLK